MSKLRTCLAATALTAVCLVSPRADASSAIEFPDNGVAQFSRGGAWLATATDPIAAYYNPAALVTQPSGAQLGMNLVHQSMCFTRLNPDGSPAPYDAVTYPDRYYPTVCNLDSGKPRFIPNFALNFRLSEQFAVGLAVVPPSSLGKTAWPDVVPVQEPLDTDPSRTIARPRPAAQRYLSMGVEGTILLPTLSVAYAPTKTLRFGAGFVSGLAILELQSMSIATISASAATDPTGVDTRSKLNVSDLFVPGAVASMHWSAAPQLDVAAWFRISDAIKAKGDVRVLGPYYDANSVVTPRPSVTDRSDGVRVETGVPMELRLGARFHQPAPPLTGLALERSRQDRHATRDPLRDDVYDVELNLSYARNSSADVTKIRFADGINVVGLPGTIPTNADRPTGYKDSYGARLGGQWNALRDRFGLRLGTWIESPAVSAEYLTVTGVPALRGGFGGGLVFRTGRLDLEFGYQHHWNAGLDNGGNGALRGIVGTGTSDNRTPYPVNGGRISQHANVVSLGGVVRF
jgi:hypothetical protein